MKKVLNNTKPYLIYSALFLIIAIIVFSIFWVKGCSFIWQADGLKQHYIILKDFNENIRSFLSNPSEGLDLFSWNMGLGLDVIGQYSYYVLGDPFAYISLIFPMKQLEYTYSFLILLRLFCIGIAFIKYAKYHQNKTKNILLGAIIYTFSSFALFAGVRHPYFLNAMILFPLLLMAVDKLLKENKKVSLAFWVAVSAISNYYFFYMHTIMIIIYAVIRYILEYRKQGIKHFLKKIGSGALSYIIGVLIASAILFPTIYAFINSARSAEEPVIQYGMDYYKSLFSINLLSAYGENWSYIGVSSIILLMLPILWVRRKKHNIYLIYLIIATIMLVIPFLGSMMNGFSFPNNRWSFMYSFILAYIVTLCFDNKYTKQEIKNMCLWLALYALTAVIAVLCIESMSCFVIYLIQIIIAFFMLMVFWYQNSKENEDIEIQEEEKIKNNKLKQWKNKIYSSIQNWALTQKFQKNKMIIMIYTLVIVNIGVMAYGLYSSYDKNYAKQFIQVESCEEELATQLGNNQNYAQNIQNIIKQDTTFYRIAKIPHQVQNLSIYYGYPSTECFLSLGNKYVYDLNTELADNYYATTSSIRGMGDRSKITTLLGTKYYVADEKNENNVPYGYSLYETIGEVKTYKNDFPLSLGVSYSQYILREEYEKLMPIEKEDILLKAVVIDNIEDLQGKNITPKENLEDVKNSYQTIEYQMIDKNGIFNENGIVETTKKNQEITLKIPVIENEELYVYISDFEFQGNDKHTITAEFQEKKVSKSVENRITSAYYQPAPEVLLPLGYYEKAEGDITLSFSAKGTYQFEQLQVLAVPMNTYEETIKNLQENELKNVVVTNHEIKGNVNLSQDSILQITTSFTHGWKAYVDGKPVDTTRVNTAFIGIPVEQGEHEIIFKYEVPYLKIGVICSIVGIILIILLWIIEKKCKIKSDLY